MNYYVVTSAIFPALLVITWKWTVPITFSLWWLLTKMKKCGCFPPLMSNTNHSLSFCGAVSWPQSKKGEFLSLQHWLLMTLSPHAFILSAFIKDLHRRAGSSVILTRGENIDSHHKENDIDWVKIVPDCVGGKKIEKGDSICFGTKQYGFLRAMLTTPEIDAWNSKVCFTLGGHWRVSYSRNKRELRNE